MLFPNRLEFRSSNPRECRLSFNSCYASSNFQKGKRRRRYGAWKRKKPKPKKDPELEEMIEELRAEQRQWPEPISLDSDHTLTPEMRTVHMLALGSLSVSVRGKDVMEVIYEEHFPQSPHVFDYLEIRLLESKDFPNSWMIDLFLSFGYTLENKFVLRYKGKWIYCKVLHPKQHLELPKMVFSSLKIDENLSQEVQQIINKRLESWKSLSTNYTISDLRDCRGVPWDLPTKAEIDLILKESEFAAWCLIFGFTPACVAMLANELYDLTLFDEFISSLVTVQAISEVLKEECFLRPGDLRPIWREDEWHGALATVADYRPVLLSDNKRLPYPSTNIAFIERASYFDREGYNHKIDRKLMNYMYGSFKASFRAASSSQKIHEAVLATEGEKRMCP